MKKLIVTGDDFGLSRAVNEAVEKAHVKGILTTASLMVGAPAAADAVERARRLPDLNVGLHLVLSNGTAVLAPSEIPDLVDGRGRFHDNQVLGGMRMFFLPAVRAQLEREIRAQFEAFRQTGLRLDHLNGHQHAHLHPTVLDLCVRIGRDFGLTAVRVPEERPVRELIDGPGEWWQRHFRWLFLKPWTGYMKRRLRAAGLRVNDRIFGLHDSGHLTQETLVRILSHLPEGISELYGHPATGDWEDPSLAAPGYDYEGEFHALVHPRTRRAMEKFGIQPAGFRDTRAA